jgi:hypothetical protein
MPDFGPAPAFDEAVSENPESTTIRRKVLFIAVDGLRADKLTTGDLKIPNFESLKKNGIFVPESHQERVSGGEYKTCPGFIQMTTGKRIAAHGVEGNDDCDKGKFEDYPIFFRRLKEMKPAIKIAVADPTSSVVAIMLESCDQNIKDKCADEARSFKKSYAGDLAGAVRVLVWIMSGGYDVVWYHPHQVDEEGHDSGWDDDPIDEVIEKLDAEVIGPLRQAVAIREAQTLERWMIIVTADHGGHGEWWGDHTDHDADKKVPIIVSGTLIPKAVKDVNAFNTWDLPATIYDYLGLTPNPEWASTDGTSILD